MRGQPMATKALMTWVKETTPNKKKLEVLLCQLSTKTIPSWTKTNLKGDGQQKTQDHPLLVSRMRKYEGNLLYLTLLYKNGNFRALNFKIILLFINLLQELKLSEWTLIPNWDKFARRRCRFLNVFSGPNIITPSWAPSCSLTSAIVLRPASCIIPFYLKTFCTTFKTKCSNGTIILNLDCSSRLSFQILTGIIIT